MRMENDVSGTSAGKRASTSPKAWESVTTRRGGRARAASRSGRPSTPVAQGKAPASSASRMTCCWGRMMRPLGAAESSGMTSTTTSPGVSRSPTSRRSSTAPVARVASARFRSLSPSPVSADTRTRAARAEAPSFSAEAVALWSAPSERGSLSEASVPGRGEGSDDSAAPARPLSASKSALFSAIT